MTGLLALAICTLLAPSAASTRDDAGARGSHAAAYALALQSGGKLVAAGSSGSFAKFRRFALSRYTSRGALDSGFGQGGKVVTDFGFDSAVSDVAIQPDGKIVAAGSGIPVVVGPPAGSHRGRAFELARYRKDGRLDATFGRGGKVLTSVGRYSGASALAIQGDGKVVVAGWSQTKLRGNSHVALVRYMRNGRLDQTFGRGGEVVTGWLTGPYNEREGGYALAIQADAKIVVTYARRTTNGVARFNTDGTLDTTFGESGKVSVKHSVAALAIQADGEIVVAGTTAVATDWGQLGTTNNPGFAVTRLTGDGSLDTSFGNEGTALTDFTLAFDTDKAASIAAVAIQPDGKIVAAGSTDALDHRGDHPNTTNDDVALARYTPEGKLDASFGRRGKVITSFGDAGNWDTGASAVVIQPNGKIVVAGPRSRGAGDDSHDLLLIRYAPNGRLDGSFGRGGKVLTDFGSG
jgi:uncharacterized delta-60 repeat protein